MYHFIINPASRSGKGMQCWEELEKYLIDNNIDHRAHFSAYPGHTTELVSKISTIAEKGGHPRHIIILGGDGTLNEAIQGIHDFDRILLSYIATGSGNDFARDMNLGTDSLAAFIHLHTDGCERKLDLGKIHYGNAYPANGNIPLPTVPDDRYFCVSCGIGFDASICEQANRSLLKSLLNRIGLGKLAYLGIGLYQLFTCDYTAAHLTYGKDSHTSLHRFLFGAVMCHKYEGGGFKFCPDADYTDGRLDLCTAGDIPRWKLPFIIPFALFGKHILFKGVHTYQSDQIRIQANVPLWVHTDGEVHVRSSHIELSCLPQKLRFFY